MISPNLQLLSLAETAETLYCVGKIGRRFGRINVIDLYLQLLVEKSKNEDGRFKMNSEVKKQLATLSMYERAILMFCLRAYFNSGNYTNKLPLGEMLPDVAAIFDADPSVNVFAKLSELQLTTANESKTAVKVFESMTYQKNGQQLVTVLNKQADLSSLRKAVEQ